MKRNNVSAIYRNLLLAGGIALAGTAPAFAETAQELYQQAQKELEKNNLRTAIIQLKNSLQEDSDFAKARLLLGKVYLQSYQFAEAEKELRRAKQLGSPKSEWVEPLGRAYLEQNKPDELLEQLKVESNDSDRVKADVQAMRGLAQLVKGDVDKGEATLKQALQLQADNVTANAGLARLLFSQGNVDQALQHAERALGKDPKDKHALLVKSEVLLSQQKVDEALTVLQQAIDADNYNIQARLIRANIYLSRKELEKANGDIEFVAGLMPEHPFVRLLRGKRALLTENFDEAQKELQAALQVMPKHTEINRLLGLIQLRNKNWQQAEAHFTQALNNNPDEISVLQLLSGLYTQGLKQPKKAVKLLEQALRRQPDHPVLLVQLSNAYMADKKYDKAAQVIERVLEEHPDADALRTKLAMAQLNQGKTDDAIAQLESASANAEQLASSDLMLAMTYIQQGEFDKANELAKGLLQKNKENPLAQNLMGVIHLAQKEPGKAKPYFERALQLNPDFRTAWLNMARVAMAQKNYSEAIKNLETLHDKQPEDVTATLALAQVYQAKGDEKTAQQWIEKSYRIDKSSLAAATSMIQRKLKEQNTFEAVSIANEFVAANPEKAEAYFLLGRAQQAHKKPSSAINAYNKAISLNPESLRFRLVLAQLLEAQEEYRAAEQAYAGVLQQQSNNVDAQLALGRLALKQEKYDVALERAEVLKKSQPLLSIGWQLEGDAYRAQEKWVKARDAYLAGYEKIPSSGLAVALNDVYSKLHQPEKGIVILQEWLNATPTDQRALFMLAAAYQQQNENDKAIEKYRELEKLAPSNVVVLNNLAWLLLDKDPKEALTYAERGAALNTDLAAALDTFGWVFVRNDRHQQGLELLQSAIQKAPEMREARYHAAVAYYKLGDNARARKMIEELIASGRPFEGRDEAAELLKRLK